MNWRRSLEPLGAKPFRYQFAAAAVSFLGNAVSPVALALGVLGATGSPEVLGLVLAAGVAPAAAFVLIGGVWADRLPRQRLIAITDSVHALTQLTLAAMFITGHLHLWAMISVQLVAGIAAAFDMPAATGLIVHTVPREHLQQANALLSLARSLTGSLGPLLASALVLTIGPGWALALDGLTFLVSAVLLSRIRVPAGTDPAQSRHFRTELREGFHEVVSRAWVWTSIIGYIATHLCLTALLVLGPAIALRRPHGAVLWAACVAAMSVGEVIGDVLALRLTPVRPMVGARFVELLAVPVLIALALDAPTATLIVTFVLAGTSMTFPDALWFTAMQQHLPASALSRVSSFEWLGAFTVQPLGYATVAAVAAWMGLDTALVGAAMLIVATRAAALSFAEVRELRHVREETVVP